MVHGLREPSLFVIVKVSCTAAAIGSTIPRGSMEIAEHIVDTQIDITTCDLHLALYITIPHGFKQEISPVDDLASTNTISKQQQFTLNIHSFKLQKHSSIKIILFSSGQNH